MKSAKTRIRITFKKIQLISSFNTISKETKPLLTLSKTNCIAYISLATRMQLSHNYNQQQELKPNQIKDITVFIHFGSSKITITFSEKNTIKQRLC
jgi:hypothetical protein